MHAADHTSSDDAAAGHEHSKALYASVKAKYEAPATTYAVREALHGHGEAVDDLPAELNGGADASHVLPAAFD
jgi:hypothetical protein